MKKELVIVIPGIKYVKSNLSFARKFEMIFYSLFERRDPVSDRYGEVWARKLKSLGKKTIWLHWSRGLISSKFYLTRDVRRLKRVIGRYKKTYDIKLLGLSIGGELALEAAKDFDDGSIKKIVLLGSVNESPHSVPEKVRITNIYSPNDIFLKLALKFFAPIHGGMRLFGKNVKNISIPSMNHDDFMGNRKVKAGKYKGKYVLDLVLREL